MVRIEVEIKEIKNGWIVDDNHYGDKTFFDDYNDAAVFAKKIFTKFNKDEVHYL